jgi:molybdopterin-containing oxidoreductase family iron-sulfur binding subunit
MADPAARYWMSLDERDDRRDESRDEFPWLAQGTLQPSRRDFLRAAGFSVAAAAAGCSQAPVERAIPLLIQPEEITPGRATYYASTCGACPAGCGLLVKNRDGRPIKLEGNPHHPVSRGGLCAVGQASVLPLYDSLRLSHPTARGARASWDEVDRQIREALDRIRGGGGAVRFVTGTVTSPTQTALIREFLAQFADARHLVYDALSTSALLDAHARTHGTRRLPRFRFDRADVIVGIDADFLGTWISPVEFTAGYRRGRVPSGQPPRLSWHVQVEPILTLTGSRADERLALGPADIRRFIAHLAARLSARAGLASAPAPDVPAAAAALLDRLVESLWSGRGHSLVVCGTQDVDLQAQCNLINQLIESYGSTIDLERPSYQRSGSDDAVATLLREMEAGSIAALFLAGVNPVYDLPEGDALLNSLSRVPLVVSFADRADETAGAATFICPDRHYLETWGDGEPVAGVVTVTQPVVQPLGDTRPLVESLAAWMDRPADARAIHRERWQQLVYPRRLTDVPFDTFWDAAVHDGFVEVTPTAGAAAPFSAPAIEVPPAAAASADAFELVLYPKIALLDGRHAHNAWLQELPDPVTKVMWDNYACVSPSTAARLGLATGDVVSVTTAEGPAAAIELPALVQPGQDDAVVAVALGYGRAGTGRFATVGPRWLHAAPGVGGNGLVGVRASGLLDRRGDVLRYTGRHVAMARTGRTVALASTQDHHSITVPASLAPSGAARRPIIEETTIDAFAASPVAGAHSHPPSAGDLWPPDHTYTGHRWGMVIDLNACTGCSACVVSCQTENNIPVVGRDEVMRHREMHWLRIDRYYEGPGDAPDVVHQPMLCQHCENAPCEVVCPVLATVHSSEGLNQQVYNRCVGTRYCANNCPYKVRRFNWFDYPREDRLQNLVLNPDVTVRSRGVMEKCSFCVQRIQEAKLEARRQGAAVEDGDVQTACQQSCPARAIVFGDLNDPSSEVARLSADPRRYRVLEELNVRPSVAYLRLVRNRREAPREEAHHA